MRRGAGGKLLFARLKFLIGLEDIGFGLGWCGRDGDLTNLWGFAHGGAGNGPDKPDQLPGHSGDDDLRFFQMTTEGFMTAG